eukprot:GDKI01013437.1.p1 GENE.GDKI01013437.1~~GDKI01013437.1.p1  ORF type:complete len:299 (+),score=17.79 GDKI01013437.1:57-953(+)
MSRSSRVPCTTQGTLADLGQPSVSLSPRSESITSSARTTSKAKPRHHGTCAATPPLYFEDHSPDGPYSPLFPSGLHGETPREHHGMVGVFTQVPTDSDRIFALEVLVERLERALRLAQMSSDQDAQLRRDLFGKLADYKVRMDDANFELRGFEKMKVKCQEQEESIYTLQLQLKAAKELGQRIRETDLRYHEQVAQLTKKIHQLTLENQDLQARVAHCASVPDTRSSQQGEVARLLDTLEDERRANSQLAAENFQLRKDQAAQQLRLESILSTADEKSQRESALTQIITHIQGITRGV